MHDIASKVLEIICVSLICFLICVARKWHSGATWDDCPIWQGHACLLDQVFRKGIHMDYPADKVSWINSQAMHWWLFPELTWSTPICKPRQYWQLKGDQCSCSPLISPSPAILTSHCMVNNECFMSAFVRAKVCCEALYKCIPVIPAVPYLHNNPHALTVRTEISCLIACHGWLHTCILPLSATWLPLCVNQGSGTRRAPDLPTLILLLLFNCWGSYKCYFSCQIA